MILSLLKYTAFIDQLLKEIEASGYVFRILAIPASPVGFADDLSLCSTSKYNTDKVLNIVNRYSCKWRIYYNAGKSAVMVYGESNCVSKQNSKFRNFSMGGKKIKEREEYDHVGIKNCLYGNSTPRTEAKISRARRAFNSITSIGIKSKGVCMSICNTVFWAIIASILTFGCELWVLRPGEIDILRKFQRYVGRRCQRFPTRTPNYRAVYSLGWISIERYVKVKKLLFLRTIMVMTDDAICKQILVHRTREYQIDVPKSNINEYNSPVFDILNTCKDFDS